jgi:hypothetical protein
MANVEIYKITKRAKNIECVAEIRGAMAFALSFWNDMEKKFLHPYDPDHEYVTRFVGSITSFMHPERENPMQEIWNLETDENVPEDLRIIMRITLDHSYCPYKFMPKLADYIENCEFANDVYKEVAKALREIHEKYKTILGVSFNCTSVVSMEEIYDKNKLWDITCN